jgi:hypothetical protein
MLGPFLWGRRARVARERDGARCDWWSGEHHARRVRFEDGVLTLGDEAVGPAGELAFALAPGAEVRLDGRRAEVAVGRSVARFELAGAEDWRVETGAWASRFMSREDAPRLVARMSEPRCRTVVKFGRR